LPPSLEELVKGASFGQHRALASALTSPDAFLKGVESEVTIPTRSEQAMIARSFRNALACGKETPAPTGGGRGDRITPYAARTVSRFIPGMEASTPRSASDRRLLARRRLKMGFMAAKLGAARELQRRSAAINGPPGDGFRSPIRQAPSGLAAGAAGEAEAARPKASANDVLVQACRARGIVAEPLLDAIRAAGGDGSRLKELRIPHHSLGDSHAQAFARALTAADISLKLLDVQDNRMTSAGASSILMAAALHSNLETLNISRNELQASGVAALCGLIRHSKSLTELRASSCSIGDPGAKSLADAISASRSTCRLAVLDLSHNGLQSIAGTAMSCLMLSSTTLTAYDLSWNAIRDTGALAIAEAVEGNRNVKWLDVAFNGFADAGTMALGTSLASNQTLTYLDLSHNSIMPKAALVLAVNLASNSTLQTLTISGNTLGQFGGRAFIRTAVGSGALDVGLDRTNMEVNDFSEAAFDPSRPQGKRVMDLDDLYGRAVAIELIRIFRDNDGVQIDSLVTSGAGVPRTVQLGRKLVPYKDDDGTQRMRSAVIDKDTREEWEVPSGGSMAVTVSMRQERAQRWRTASMKAVSGVINMLRRKSLTSDERSTLVRLAAEDMTFTGAQAALIVNRGAGAHEDKYEMRHSRSRVGMARSLLPRIISEGDQGTFIDSVLDGDERESFATQIGQLADFSVTNPTGHYRLDLGDANDRQLMQQLLQTNNVEARLSRASGCGDTSQLGNWENFRNSTFNHQATRIRGNMQIPNTGVFEFDYVSTARPPPDAPTLKAAHMVRVVKGVCAVLGINDWPFLVSTHAACQVALSGSGQELLLPPPPKDDQPSDGADPGPFPAVEIASSHEAVATARALGRSGSMRQIVKHRRMSLMQVPKLSRLPEFDEASDGSDEDSDGSGSVMTPEAMLHGSSTPFLRQDSAPSERGAKLPGPPKAPPAPPARPPARAPPTASADVAAVSGTLSSALAPEKTEASALPPAAQARGRSDLMFKAAEAVLVTKGPAILSETTADPGEGRAGINADSNDGVAASSADAAKRPGKRSMVERINVLKRAVSHVKLSEEESFAELRKVAAKLGLVGAEADNFVATLQREEKEAFSHQKEQRRASQSRNAALPSSSVAARETRDRFPAAEPRLKPQELRAADAAAAPPSSSTGLRPALPTAGVTSDSAISAVAAFSEQGVIGAFRRKFNNRPTSRPAAVNVSSGPAHTARELDQCNLAVKMLRAMTSEMYVSIDQAEVLVRLIPPRFQFARIEAVVAIFSRVADLRFVWKRIVPLVGPWEQRAKLCNRLGWLNVINPEHSEGFYHMNLTVRDQHWVVDTLVILAVAEPGPNIMDEAHCHHGYWFPGWQLPASWIDRIPPIGEVVLTYVSDLPGCAVLPSARRMLAKRYLVSRTGHTDDDLFQLYNPKE